MPYIPNSAVTVLESLPGEFVYADTNKSFLGKYIKTKDNKFYAGEDWVNLGPRLRRATNKATIANKKEKVYKNFMKKLGGQKITNENYEEFFTMLSKDFVKAGLDPDTVRLKMDQIMEWKDPNAKA